MYKRQVAEETALRDQAIMEETLQATVLSMPEVLDTVMEAMELTKVVTAALVVVAEATTVEVAALLVTTALDLPVREALATLEVRV